MVTHEESHGNKFENNKFHGIIWAMGTERTNEEDKLQNTHTHKSKKITGNGHETSKGEMKTGQGKWHLENYE